MISYADQMHGAYLERYAVAERLRDAAEMVDTTPTEAQKKAGNYQKGRVTIQGLPITIENPRGSIRSGKSQDGKEWSVTMACHYGYIRRTESEADGDHIDVFIGPDPESQLVFIVDQQSLGGRFDEHKCMLGFTSESEARKGYLACYSSGWTGLRSITPLTMESFKRWLDEGDTGKGAAEQISHNYAAETPAAPAPLAAPKAPAAPSAPVAPALTFKNLRHKNDATWRRFVAFHGGKRIGSADVMEDATDKARRAFPQHMPKNAKAYRLGGIYLDPAHRGQGHGQALYKHVYGSYPEGTRFFNSNTEDAAAHTLDALHSKGDIELQRRGQSETDNGAHLAWLRPHSEELRSVLREVRAKFPDLTPEQQALRAASILQGGVPWETSMRDTLPESLRGRLGSQPTIRPRHLPTDYAAEMYQAWGKATGNYADAMHAAWEQAVQYADVASLAQPKPAAPNQKPLSLNNPMGSHIPVQAPKPTSLATSATAQHSAATRKAMLHASIASVGRGGSIPHEAGAVIRSHLAALPPEALRTIGREYGLFTRSGDPPDAETVFDAIRARLIHASARVRAHHQQPPEQAPEQPDTGQPNANRGGTAEAPQATPSGGAPRPSTASIHLAHGVDEEIADDLMHDLFPGHADHEQAYQDITGLVGAPDDARVNVSEAGHYIPAYSDDVVSDAMKDAVGVRVKISHPKMDRFGWFVGKDGDGERFMRLEIIEVKKAHQGEGLGADIIQQSIENAAHHGFNYINLHAAGDPTNPDQQMNGFYTWPMFGWDENLESIEEHNPDLADRIRGAYPNAESVLDIVQTTGGRQWWKKNGGDLFAATFDLSEGSRSRQQLGAYLEEKQAKKRGK